MFSRDAEQLRLWIITYIPVWAPLWSRRNGLRRARGSRGWKRVDVSISGVRWIFGGWRSWSCSDEPGVKHSLPEWTHPNHHSTRIFGLLSVCVCVCACSSAGYFPNLCVTDRYGLFKDFFACTHFLVCASLLFLPAMTTKFKKINKSRVKYVKSCANSSQNRMFYVAQSRFLMFKGSCYVILANTGSLHAKILPSRSFLIYQN